MKIRELVDKHFDGDRKKAAEAAGVSLQFFNNWVSQNREVMRLESGDFVLVTSTMKIIKTPENND